MAGAHSVAEDMEEAGSAGLINRVNNQNAVSFYHFLIEGCIVILLGADHALAHHKAAGAGYTAGAELNIPVEYMDEFNFGTCIAGSFQCDTAHGVIISVFRTTRETKNFHKNLLKSVFYRTLHPLILL